LGKNKIKKMKKCAALIILDGFGLGENDAKKNAIFAARTPFLDFLFEKFPHSKLAAGGAAVGVLPSQCGSSDIGHETIGTGRVARKPIKIISDAIDDGSFFKNQKFFDAVNFAKKNNGNFHLFGIGADSFVHSHTKIIFAFLEFLKKNFPPEKVFLHFAADGRDNPPDSGKKFFEQILNFCAEKKIGKLASIFGRFFLDRGQNWDRTEKIFKLLFDKNQKFEKNWREFFDKNYAKKIFDEFLPPTAFGDEKIFPRISRGDAIFDFCFRADRQRQITAAITEKNFTEFSRAKFSEIFAEKNDEKNLKFKNKNAENSENNFLKNEEILRKIFKNEKNFDEKNLKKIADFCGKNGKIGAEILAEKFEIKKNLAEKIWEKIKNNFGKNGGKNLENGENFGEKKIYFLGAIQYSPDLKNAEFAFSPEKSKTCLAEILEKNGFRQLHISGREKIIFVTFNFNRSANLNLQNEIDECAPQTREVENFAENPEMSTPNVAKKILEKLRGENLAKKIAENFKNEKKIDAKKLEKILENEKIDEKKIKKIAEICAENNFDKKICEKKIAEILKIEKKNAAEILKKIKNNFGEKNFENEKNYPEIFVINFENCDQVGHTGDFAAAKKAVESVDAALKKIVPAFLENDFEILVTADHGNADEMCDDRGRPHTAHTKNPVPAIFISANLRGRKLRDGALSDVAPTFLEILNLKIPREMTGKSLFLEK